MDADPSPENLLELRGIHKAYDRAAAVAGVDLALRRGEVFSLLGPSGCGKTTLLRLAAGFLSPDAGSVWLEGKEITHLPPNKRHLNTVFQHYALFPHMTVRENVAFGPRMARQSTAGIRSRVDTLLGIMELEDQADKRPGTLSGGQRQRVALARALINDPAVLLLDEPLGALDLKLRQRMMLELSRLQARTGTTFLYVTHDQNEAMTLSHRMAVMDAGRLLQVGPPKDIYERPANAFVAAFIGDTHFLKGTITEGGAHPRAHVEGLGEVSIPDHPKIHAGKQVTISLRPERLKWIPCENEFTPDGSNRFRGELETILFQGAWTLSTVRLGAERIPVMQPSDTLPADKDQLRPGISVELSWRADQSWLLWD